MRRPSFGSLKYLLPKSKFRADSEASFSSHMVPQVVILGAKRISQMNLKRAPCPTKEKRDVASIYYTSWPVGLPAWSRNVMKSRTRIRLRVLHAFYMNKCATWLPNGSQGEANWLPKGDPRSCKIMSGTSVDSLGLPEGWVGTSFGSIGTNLGSVLK